MTEKKHIHIWKHIGEDKKVCEAPFPTIESCGAIAFKNAAGQWLIIKQDAICTEHGREGCAHTMQT